jgi:hypothetical protein
MRKAVKKAGGITAAVGSAALLLVVTTALLSGNGIPRTIGGTEIHVPPKENRGLTVNGRQTVLFVEDPAGLGVPSPDQYWSAVLDSILGTGNYAWFGPTAGYGDNGPDLTTMQGYDLVIWDCYDCWNPAHGPALTATDQTNVASYVSGGGKVWLIGQDILYSGVPLSWMQTYFNLQSVVQDYGEGFPDSIPFPVRGAGELSGYGFSILVDWESDLFPDDLTPNANAHVVVHDSVNSADPAILSDDWTASFWTVDGRNPNPWLDWQETVFIMLGGFGVLGVEEQSHTSPPSLGFGRIMPNPAMSGVTICYFTSGANPVTLCIYDRAGRLVRNLLNGDPQAGWNSTRWDGNDNSHQPVPAGCYFCVLSAEGGSIAKKIVLLGR